MLSHEPHKLSPNWDRHVRSLEPQVSVALARVQHLDRWLKSVHRQRVEAVAIARREGATWPQVAAALEISRQGAERVYKRHCLNDEDLPAFVDVLAGDQVVDDVDGMPQLRLITGTSS